MSNVRNTLGNTVNQNIYSLVEHTVTFCQFAVEVSLSNFYHFARWKETKDGSTFVVVPPQLLQSK